MEKVREWIQTEMTSRGLQWDSSGARLCADKAMASMIHEVPLSLYEGLYHFQLLADGVNVYRTASVCNVGLKLFDSSPGFNSLTSMTLL